MTTVRVSKRKRYAAIAREAVNDVALSFRARGVLVWLLDKPDDWQTDAKRIAEQGKEGRDAIRAALNELAFFGYLRREKYRDRAGRWATDWTVFECPPGRETSTGEPATDSQALLPNTETELERSFATHAFAATELEHCAHCGKFPFDCRCAPAREGLQP